MNLDIIITLLFGLILVIVGVFCLVKMLTVRPHRLKKEDVFRIEFRDDIPEEEDDEPYATFKATRVNLAGTVILGIIAAIMFCAAWLQRDGSFAFFGACATFGALANLAEGTKSVRIHRYGIVIKTAFRGKFHAYRDLDCLESFNVLNSFHKGVSHGYRFMKDNQPVVAMDIRQYKNVSEIESVFARLPHITK